MRPMPFAAAALAILFAVPGLVRAAEERLVEDFDATWKDGRWTFSNGAEFPGAKGALERSQESAHGGQWAGRLAFDFTGGGNYVAAVLGLEGTPDVAAVRVWVKKPRGQRLTFRYTDPTGQTLQKGFIAGAGADDGRWADVLIPMSGWTGHWGGASDGVVHGPPHQIAFLAENSGRAQGAVFLDDVRLIPGKPGEGAGMRTSEHVAARFAPEEEWRSRTAGNAGATKLDGRTWRFDFTKGAAWVGIAPKEFSLLGRPREIRLRVRGKAPGHPVRVQFATHFMTFEKTVGELAGDGDVSELVIAAPPGEGWRWSGGENDGKIHGPLRPRGIFLEAAGRSDAGELELIDLRVKGEWPPDRACVLVADRRDGPAGGEFVATIRSLAPEPLDAALAWTIRDWGAKTVAEGRAKVTVPAAGEPVEVKVPSPPGRHRFLEAEFVLDAPGQATPAVQAYSVAPPEEPGGADLDPASPFGMGLYLYRYPGDAAGLKEMDRAAQMAQDAGVKWSREEFGWGRVEPQPRKFNWAFYDALVATAKRHGISIYGLLSYWAGWTKAYTPEGIEAYCGFAAAAAARYKDDIQHWEIWNEPNIFFWQGPKDMYADLLKQAYTAIKLANPKALVLGCSTAGIDTKFIRRTMELGAPFDILTIHPYRASLNDRAFVADLQKAADLVKRPDGTRREVWITEMGWATHVPHNAIGQGFQVNSERDQACLLARAYIDAIASGAAPNISWYDFRNDGTDPLNFEHNMGIVTRDFRPKPAYRAFATVTRVLKGKRVEKGLDLGPDVVAYRFAGAGGRGPVIALWNLDEEQTVSVPAGKGATLTDLMGGTSALAPADGKVSVALQPGVPVFVTPGE